MGANLDIKACIMQSVVHRVGSQCLVKKSASRPWGLGGVVCTIRGHASPYAPRLRLPSPGVWQEVESTRAKALRCVLLSVNNCLALLCCLPAYATAPDPASVAARDVR